MKRIALLILACISVIAAERRLSLDTYRDKMEGGWLGQIIGVTWGAPTEFKWNSAIIPEDKVPKWTPDMINHGFGQDDLYVEMTFLRTLELYGLDVDIRQAGIDFANSKYGLWCANKAGRDNLRAGIAPPDSSHPKFNSCPNDIDYQIEADYAGLIAPGLPQAAIDLGEKFGRLMSYGDGVYGGQFVGAMYCEAFFSDDIGGVIQAGLRAIPKESQYAEMVRDMVAWHREKPDDWQFAWHKAVEKYRKDKEYQKASNGNIDVKINGAMILLGLLYGNKDMEATTVISMRGGFDSDCNPSNAAGVLGTMLGKSKLESKYVQALKRDAKFAYTAYSVNDLLKVSELLMRQVVVRYGGRIEGDTLVIPQREPKPSKLELSWAPGPIANSLFTEEEMNQIEFKLHPAHKADVLAPKDPTAKVQAVLDVLFPGWKTTENAKDMNPGYRAEHHGRKHILMTHPKSRTEGAALWKDITVPETGAKLHVSVAPYGKQGDFTLEIRIDGKQIQKQKIQEQGEKIWFDIIVDLNPYAGKTIRLELDNQPDNWYCEAAYWQRLEVKVDID